MEILESLTNYPSSLPVDLVGDDEHNRLPREALLQLKEWAKEGIDAIHGKLSESEIGDPTAVQRLGGNTEFFEFEFTYGPLYGRVLAHRNGSQLVRPYFNIEVAGHETAYDESYMVQSARIRTHEEAREILVASVVGYLETIREKHVPAKSARKQ